MTGSLSDKVIQFCQSGKSVSGELGKDALLPAHKAAHKLYCHHPPKIAGAAVPADRPAATAEELETALQCGKFGDQRPSDLFLRIFYDTLKPLEYDPLIGNVSPSLIGTSGVVPLSIIGSMHDICRHMSNLIARAEQEVFLATNYWMNSKASALITDALRELSKRAGERGQRAVVKLLYDRGNIKQVYDPHQSVGESTRTSKAVGLPAASDLPNVDLQVVNYHRFPLGTFHAKFMVVDRKYGVVSSNNIQDNDNLEMAVHLEGPIVNSLYDVALISWHHSLDPPLPCIDHPEKVKSLPAFEQASFRELFDDAGNPVITIDDPGEMQEHLPGAPQYDPDIASEIARVRSTMIPRNGESKADLVARHLNATTGQVRKATAAAVPHAEAFQPYWPHAPSEPVPMAMVNRRPYGFPNHKCCFTPQCEAWLSALRNAQRSVFVQTPDLNAEPLLPAILAAARRGINVTYYVCLGYNDAGELLPMQNGHNEMVAARLHEQLEPEHRANLQVHYYVGKDQDRPIHNKFKGRSCHIKLMIVDGHVGIQGSGNLDTQSFFHSQEINVMIDSEKVCGDWIEALRRNQNTHIHGRASPEDGVWRDENGKEAEGAIGKDPGRFAWATGIMGAIDRVRGVGGF